MTVRHERTTLVCNGVALSVHRWHPAAAVAAPAGACGATQALLLHGFLDVGYTWNRVATRLAAAGLDVVAPDLRGFGRSGHVPDGAYYHFPDYVADVRDLVAQAIERPMLLVGHSMGGTVATLYAGTFPDEIARLVLMEGVGPMAEPPELGVLRMRRWLADLAKTRRTQRAMASREQALDKLAETHPRVPRETLAEVLPHLLADGDPPRWAYDPLHRSTSPIPFSAALFASYARAVTSPTLFVGGGPHGWHPPDEAERLTCFARLETLELPDAGHMMHWTHADAVADRILAAPAA